MTSDGRAEDEGPRRDEDRPPNRRWHSDRVTVLLGALVQVVALIGQIVDLTQ
ncbi:hypothetical protein [Saccharothrix australiensis]|uniref:Uncharacterized protein n=1 Tax=Saccharothrix australiensis TaxID=2072 RepID=A0A495VWC7_9PSEU|nr:hypothetical protein [Saccharothrix australiensis]RKT53662.1 hypothetical protein C8E97_2241 [Saccharothrix australiensis]